MVDVLVVTDGDAASFHGRPLPDDGRPHVWWFQPVVPAVVLGSTQDRDIVDLEECSRRGIDVVTRRSGGGIVIVGPDLTLWIDVLVPRHHRLWDDDIGRATWWLGDVWAEALADVEIAGDVHRGPMQATDLSRLVCFAGRGPGEVVVSAPNSSASKAVGISQRRTREWARFQCALSLRWDADLHRRVVRTDSFDPSALEHLGTDLDLDPSVFGRHVVARLVDRLGG